MPDLFCDKNGRFEEEAMDCYVTGAVVKRLREGRGMTQSELARLVDVGDKAVSRWECGRGYPDITSWNHWRPRSACR